MPTTAEPDCSAGPGGRSGHPDPDGRYCDATSCCAHRGLDRLALVHCSPRRTVLGIRKTPPTGACHLASSRTHDDSGRRSSCGGEASAPATALNWLLFCQRLQCPVQLLGGREHQPSEQRWLRCGRTMQCSRCYDSKLQRTRNSPEGRLKRKHTITDAVQLWNRTTKHRAEHSQGDLGRRCHLRRLTPIRLPSSEPELLWAIVKVDSTGKVQWANDLLFATSATPYSSPTTWPFDIQQTTDGGFVLVGYAIAPGENYNPWIAKLSSTGQLQWTHVFVDPNSQYSAAQSVRQTADGGYIVGGEVSYAVTSSYTESEITVFKLDSTGTLVWQRDYAAGVDAYFQSLALTSDGGAIASGTVSTQTATTYTSSVLLLKLDSTGQAQFARTILPSGNISDLNIVGVQQTADGGYAFAGYYFQNTVYTERAWLIKTDSAGNVLWDKIYGPDVQYSDRYFHSFQQASDGGFIAAGSTNQFNGGDNSIWLVKTDSN